MKTKTQLIFESRVPWDNPYQGKDKRVVFVCSAGILRSATAARIYAQKYNTRSAGSEGYALIPLSDELVLWAQEIVFVNKQNYLSVKDKYSFDDTKVVVLDIPDVYNHMHPKLIAAFEEQYEKVFP